MNWWKRNEADIYYSLALVSFAAAVLVMFTQGWPGLGFILDNPYVPMVLLLTLLGKVTDMSKR